MVMGKDSTTRQDSPAVVHFASSQIQILQIRREQSFTSAVFVAVYQWNPINLAR